jgi:hypothetical protein
VTIDDGASGPQGTNPTGTVSITVNPLNDAPTATNLDQSLTINEDAAATTLFTLAPVVSDVDSTNVTATLTLSAAAGVLNGAGAGVLNAGVLTYTITGTQAAVNSALAAVTYDSAQDFNGSASVGVTIDDGASGPQGTNPTGSVSITVNPVNDAPTLTATGNNPAYTPGGVDLFSTVTASTGPANESTQQLQKLVLTVTHVSGVAGEDVLTIDGTAVDLDTSHSETTTGPLGVNAAVAYDSGTGTTTVTITSAGLSAANMASLVDGLSYTDNNVTAGEVARVVTLTSLQDTGGGTAPNVDTATLNIASTVNFNVAPTITAGDTLNYIENATSVIDPTITITDPDNANMTGAKVTITTGFNTAQDVLSFTPIGAITGSYNSTTGVLTLSGSDTKANYELALESVTYHNNSDDPTTTQRTVSYTVNDGFVDSAPATATVNVTAVNDEPTLTATALNPGFTENGSAVTLFSGAAASAIEAAQSLDQLVLNVTNVAGTGATEDLTIDGTIIVLTNGNTQTTATNGMSVVVALAAGTATVTISKVGGISSTAMNTLVDSLAYSNTSEDPGNANRVVTLTSLRDTGANGGPNNDDNIHSGLTVQSTVAVTPVNDEPTLTATANGGGTVTFIEDSSPGVVGSGPVDLFSTPHTSTVESGQTITQVVLTVTGVADTTEYLNIGGTPVELTNHSEAITVGGAGGTATVSVTAGTATITVTPTTTFSAANVDSLVDSLAYNNDDNTPTATTHTISVTSLTDSGSNIAPNDNTGSPSVSTIVTVQPTNDAPTAQDFNFTGNTANDAIGNTALVLDDTSVAGAPDPAGPQKTINGSLLTGATDPDGPNALATVAVTNQATTHGHVTINTSGEFSYTPNAGYIGNDTFTYTITDGNTPTAGTDTGNVTLNVAAPKVWYVSSSTGSDVTGDGTSEHPFASLAPLSTGGSADSLDGANDTIFVYNGTYTGGIVLESGQQLIGQSQGLTVNGTTLETASAGNATINGTVTLTSGNTIDGITFGNTSGFSLQDSGATVGTATVAHSSINNANGGAVSIANGGTLAMNFSSISASGTSTSAIALANTTGTFTGSGGTLNNGAAAAADVAITGDHVNDDLNFTYNGAINDSTGTTVAISGQSGGTKDFNGAITGGGIALTTNNAGATVNFDGALSLSTGASAAFAASGGGTLNVTNGGNSITTTTGTALNLNGITVGTGVAFNSVTTNGAANGILIDTVGQSAGSTGIDINGGSIVNASSRGVDINATSADISIASGISTTAAGRSVEVTGTTGSKTIAFSGAIDDNGLGINLATNTGTTMNFTGGLQIDTASGSTGFSATGGGTVNVTGSNHIASTGAGGTALNVANTTIGASGLTFHDISANGATNGIVLNNTGATAGLTVTGSGNATQGGDSSGGVIQNTSGDAISLTSTLNPSFTNMNIHNNAGSGIHGTTVTGFTFDNGTLSTNGDSNVGGSEEANIRFDSLLSSGSITDSSISGGYAENVLVMNRNGTLDRLTITNDAFGLINATGGNDNIHIEVGSQAGDNGTLKTTISNNTFAGTRSDFVEVIANNNTTLDVVARSNVFHNGQAIIPGGGVALSIRSGSGGLASAANTTYDISHNTLTDGGANAFDTVGIFVAKGQDNGTLSGTIASNAIGPANPDISPAAGLQPANADGIFVRSAGTGTNTVLIQNNTITGYGAAGIHLQNNDGSSTMNASIFGNTESSPNSVNFSGIFVDNGATATDTSTTNVVIGSANAGETAKQNTFHGTVIDVSLSNFNAATHFNLSRNGSAAGTAAGVIQDDNVGTPTVDTSGGAGPITLVNTVPALPAVVAPMLAAPGGVQASSPTPGETHLTQAQLDSVVAAAIAGWAAAGASASQLAALHATVFSVEDLAGNTISEQSPGLITVDVDAAGHGWFVDPTPGDNSEFTHAQNAAGTDLLTDPSNAAAGHLDLLTAVSHELGHVLGLDDIQSPADDLMFINLVDGERRMPDAADVAQANVATVEAAVPVAARAAAGTPIVTGTAGNDTIDAGHGGNVLFGGAGADNFVFGPSIQLNAPTPAQVTHVADYSAAQGDSFDFSAITSAFHNSSVNDSLVVRAVEDASGKFATLQVDHIDPMGLPSAPNWVNVAQIDGAHAGDAVNILIDNHSVHLAQIHVDLLV